MNHLIITLPLELPQPGSQLDYLLSPDGHTLASHSRAAPALLPNAAHGEVVVVVPVQALSWHSVQLPRGLLAKNFLSESSSPRLRAVLEGLLEERLLDDPALLHFALSPNARDGAPLWVAACDRAWLRAWLQTLETSAHPVARIVPEFAPDDARPEREVTATDSTALTGGNVLQVIGTPQRALIVFTPAGKVGDNLPPTAALSVLPLSHDGVALANWPEEADILAEPGVAALAEEFFKRRVNLQQSAQRWLRSSQSRWDLAQFDLQNNNRSRSWKRVTGALALLRQSPRWRAARWALGAALLANLAGLNAWAWAERSSVQGKQLAIRDVLTSTFPNVKVVVDAPVQMARELALLRQGTGASSGGDFDTLLASFGALALANGAPTAIDYSAGEVRIKGLDLTAAQIAEATEQLRRQALTVTTDGGALSIKPQVAP